MSNGIKRPIFHLDPEDQRCQIVLKRLDESKLLKEGEDYQIEDVKRGECDAALPLAFTPQMPGCIRPGVGSILSYIDLMEDKKKKEK